MKGVPIGSHKIHKYERVNISRDKTHPYFVYRCTLPNCNHYLNENLIWGKASICHRCDNEFIIQNKARLTGVKRPYCDDCKDLHWNAKRAKSKATPVVKSAVADLLARMGIEPRSESEDTES